MRVALYLCMSAFGKNSEIKKGFFFKLCARAHISIVCVWSESPRFYPAFHGSECIGILGGISFFPTEFWLPVIFLSPGRGGWTGEKLLWPIRFGSGKLFFRAETNSGFPIVAEMDIFKLFANGSTRCSCRRTEIRHRKRRAVKCICMYVCVFVHTICTCVRLCHEDGPAHRSIRAFVCNVFLVRLLVLLLSSFIPL